MKKYVFLILTALIVTPSAFADSFACTLKVKDQASTVHETDRSREAQVELGGFICQAKLEGDKVTGALFDDMGINLVVDQQPAGRDVKMTLGYSSCSCGLM